MLDARSVFSDFEAAKAKLAARGSGHVESLSQWQALDQDRKKIIQEVEELKSKRNSESKKIGQLKGKERNAEGDEKAAITSEIESIMEQTRNMGDQIQDCDHRIKEIEEKIHLIAMGIPNLAHETVPEGKSEDHNRFERKWGNPKEMDFEPKDHVTLGEELGILDFERAGKLSGARFSLYTGAGAVLERALIQYMLDEHIQHHGYTEVIPPFLVLGSALEGTGQLPKFEEDLFKVRGEKELYLIPTAEVPLTNIHADEILKDSDLPIYYTGYTPCFRSEAGSYGKDTRGLVRLHQFQKVEMVKLCRPEESYEELEKMTANAEHILKQLELPYQVLTLCTGDMGFGASKTYDIEVWVPSQKTYREISSCSNCEAFQARRAKIRYRADANSKPEFVHTLNGSGLAVGRTFLAILENHQQKDGTIRIPEVLESYLKGKPGFDYKGGALFLVR